MWNSFDTSQTVRHVLQLYLHLVRENTLLGRYVICPQASLRQPRDHKTQSVGHRGTCFTLLIVRSEEMILLKLPREEN